MSIDPAELSIFPAFAAFAIWEFDTAWSVFAR